MSLLSADQLARDQALDVTRSLILQAPAGSGKTTLLMQRFLCLLATVEEPEAVLAMTFTRKAAGELRARIEAALQAAAQPVESWSEDVVERRTLELAARVLKVDAERGWGLRQSVTRLRVQTIDGVNRSLAAAVPVTASGIGDLGLALQPLRLYREVARQCLIDLENDAELGEISGLLFERLDNSWALLEERLAIMLQQRARWLPRLVGIDPVDLRREIEIVVTLQLEAAIGPVAARIDPAARREVAAIAAIALEHLSVSAPTSALLDSLRSLAAARDRDDWSIAEWRALASFVMTKSKDEPALRKARGINVTLGFPPSEKALKDRMRAWLQAHDEPSLTALLDALRRMPSAEFNESDQQVFDNLVRFLLLAAAQLELEFRERGETDFVAIGAAARSALRATEDELSLRLLHQGTVLQHLLVDEFQDTSQDQYELIAELTRDWQVADGRTIFVVGDPMQSIYQFREARVDLFQRACERGLRHLPLQFAQLGRNFRSQPVIVDFVNECFAKIFPREFAVLEAAVPYSPSVAAQQAISQPGVRPDYGVFCHALRSELKARDASEEALEILQLVRELRESAAIKSIAILVAARPHAELLVSTLQANEIAVVGLDLLPLSETPVVKDLMSLTLALASPLDRVAWLSLLRAAWCGLELADLTHLVEAAPRAAIIELWQDEARLSRLSPIGRRRLEWLRSIVLPLILDDSRALAAKVEAAWLQLGGPACYPEPTALGDARTYLDVLAAALARPSGAIREELPWLLDGLYSGATVSADATAVQVMTIHRAKGLEFDAVILPGLARKPRSDEAPLLGFLEWQDDGETRTVMAPCETRKRNSAEPTLASWVQDVNKRRATRERARLLYVAATRAKRALHLFADISVKDDEIAAPPASSPLGILWPALAQRFKDAVDAHRTRLPRQSPLAMVTPTSGSTLRRLPEPDLRAHWPRDVTVARLALSSAELDAGRSADEGPVVGREIDEHRANILPTARGATVAHAREIGIVIHQELERLGNFIELSSIATMTAQDELRWQRSLRALGVVEAQLAAAASWVARALRNTLNDSDGRWLLNAHEGTARSEWALTGIRSGRLINVIVDRSFVHQGVRWVIDYKTAIPPDIDSGVALTLTDFIAEQVEWHTAQLAGYADLLRAYDQRPLRAALYFPMLPRLVELDL